MILQNEVHTRTLKRLYDLNRRDALGNNRRHLMMSEVEQIIKALDNSKLLTKPPVEPAGFDIHGNPSWPVVDNDRLVGSVSIAQDYSLQITTSQMSFGRHASALKWSDALEGAGTYAISSQIDYRSGSPPNPLKLDHDYIRSQYPGFDLTKGIIKDTNQRQSRRPGTPELDDETIDRLIMSLFSENLIYIGLPSHVIKRYDKAAIWDINCKDETDGEIQLWGSSVYLESHSLSLRDGLHAVLTARAIQAAVSLSATY